ncbi:MAG: ATP-dependent DNA ligase [Acidimicrobiales bacterium]
MRLPVQPPVSPMLAKGAAKLPEAGGLLYEPKWDGFRCIIFRDGDEVELGSRNERPLTRYFPDVCAAARAGLPDRCVVDGEIVIAGRGGLDFDALLNRIHPADSRVQMLAVETPASFVAFDLLALGDRDLRTEPFSVRREMLVAALGAAGPPLHVTPATEDRDQAIDWFVRFEGAGLDGVVAKPLHLPYREGERVMVKVKHERTADVVVAGFRWHKSGGVVGSLLLGLWAGGRLQHIGVSSAFTAKRRVELVEELTPLRLDEPGGHPWAEWASSAAHAAQRLPGATSRWNAGKDLSFVLLRPELVAEVAFNQLQGDRLRHPAQFLRWRPDRDAASCTYDQLETAVPEELAEVFAAGR